MVETRRDDSITPFWHRPFVRMGGAMWLCVIAFLPAPIWIGTFALKPQAVWVWIAFLLGLSLYCVWMTRILSMRPALKSSFVYITSLVLCALFADASGRLPFWSAFLLCAVCVIPVSAMGVRVHQILLSDALHIGWSVGLVVHFAAFIYFPRARILPSTGWIIWLSCFITLVSVLFRMNQLRVNELLASKQSNVPYKVRRFNHLVVTIFIAIIFLVFAILKLAVNWAALEHAIDRMLHSLFSHRANHSPSTPTPTEPRLPKLSKQLSQQPTHATPGIWQHIAIAIILIVLALACLYVVFLLVKKIWNWYLRQQISNGSELAQYVDTEESITPDAQRIFRRFRARSKAREPDLSTPEQRVRHSYRQFVLQNKLQGYPWTEADTARQTTERIRAWLRDNDEDELQAAGTDHASARSPEEWATLKNLYDKARYSREGLSSDMDPELPSSVTKSGMFPEGIRTRSRKKSRRR